MRLPDLRHHMPAVAAPFVLSALAIAAPKGPADQIASAVADALASGDAAVARIVDVPSEQRTYDNTVGAIDDIVAQLELDTNMILFMPYVSSEAEVREAGQQAEVAVQDWLIDPGHRSLARGHRMIRSRGSRTGKMERAQCNS